MQFLVIAMDRTDEGAPQRRQKLREAHLAGLRKLRATQNFIMGGALLDEEGEVIGSSVVYDFPDRVMLDEALALDPYSEGGVWDGIVVHPFRVAAV